MDTRIMNDALSADKDCLVSDSWEGDGWNIKPLEMKT